MKPEHEKVVIDMISRSFADKGDLTTLAGVNYDNLYEQGSLDIHYIKIGRYFSVSNTREGFFDFGKKQLNLNSTYPEKSMVPLIRRWPFCGGRSSRPG